MNPAAPSPQLAVALAGQGRHAEALACAQAYCESRPDDADGWFALAGLHAQRGELAPFANCCRKLVALQPENATVHHNLGVALQTLGQLPEAADSIRRAIAGQPGFAPAHSDLCSVLWRMGRYEEALASGQEATRLDPALAMAHNNLSLVLRSLRRLDEASAACREALRLKPGFAAHYNLGLCLMEQGRLEEAVSHLTQALQIKPDAVEAHRDLALLHLQRGEIDRAAESFERRARLRPADVEAQLDAGTTLLRTERYADAVRYCRQAVATNPKSAQAHLQLGIALHSLALRDGGGGSDRYLAAEESLRKAAALDPTLAAAYYYLGNCAQQRGRLNEAHTHLQIALSLKPDHAEVRADLARLLEQKGEFDAAQAALQPLLDQHVESPPVALALASLSRHTGRQEEAIAMLKRVLAEPSELRVRSRMDCHYALGKLHEENEQFDLAFEHYRWANELSPDRFDPAASERIFDELIAAYSKDRQSGRPRASNRSHLPVFIVGMPRSGTSLVEQILASHPLVHGAGELLDVQNTVAALPGQLGTKLPYPHCLDALTRKNIDPLAQRHLDRLGKLADGKARVTDKMPHNFIALGFIDLLFPEARIIHCTRDPIDTCLSIYCLHFNQHHAYARDLGHAGLFYRQYRRLMAHWKTVLRVPMLEVNYETLVDRPEVTIRQLIEFIGLDWDDRCLRFHESKRAVATPSYAQVRQPLYQKSVARWKHFERHLGPLIEALGDDALSGQSRVTNTRQ